ncbi:hypothetical protein DdX_03020 [Ditylenchus destructor]|uniref:Uncharacterized protein n=1 Tax=Ditylenchus destructor TaxID=166010 RepID=A0AAD4NIZ5_9BILA|nr:hypothetical protein DdX_03020 [Ditylenchus destructor]
MASTMLVALIGVFLFGKSLCDTYSHNFSDAFVTNWTGGSEVAASSNKDGYSSPMAHLKKQMSHMNDVCLIDHDLEYDDVPNECIIEEKVDDVNHSSENDSFVMDSDEDIYTVSNYLYCLFLEASGFTSEIFKENITSTSIARDKTQRAPFLKAIVVSLLPHVVFWPLMMLCAHLFEERLLVSEAVDTMAPIEHGVDDESNHVQHEKTTVCVKRKKFHSDC